VVNKMASRKWSKKIALARDIALQRMQILFDNAVRSVRNGNIRFARRYCILIKKISMRNKVKIPRRIKRAICKNCFIPLIPGVTCRVRIKSEGKNSRIVVTCLVCGWIHRYRFKGPRT